jgi:acyl-CoA dehydrogenase
MGFVEETGAAQHLRDARIAAIYEGTNGIQAIDLVLRKLPLSGGEAVKALITEMRGIVSEVEAANTPGFGHTAARLRAAVDSLERATEWMLATMGSRQADALAGATPYLKLFALAQGGTGLAKKALALRSEEGGANAMATARFYAEHAVTEAPALELTVTEGAGAVEDAAAVFAA